MNKNTLKITNGALLIALFGMLQFMNRQTGGALNGVFMYLLPIPMVAYSAMYGWKSSLPVLMAMGLISFLLGNITSVFYSISEAAVGLIFGTCLHKRMDTTKTLFVVMFASIVANLFNTLVVAAMYGINLQQDIVEMQEIMRAAFERLEQPVPEAMLDEGLLTRLFLVTMIFSSALQGFIVYEISLLILKRLRFPVQPPRPIASYHPPRWSAYVGIITIYFYLRTMTTPFENDLLQSILQMIGIAGYIYLMIFGWISLMLWFRSHFMPRAKLLPGILAFLVLLMLPQVGLLMGFVYVSRLGEFINKQVSVGVEPEKMKNEPSIQERIEHLQSLDDKDE